MAPFFRRYYCRKLLLWKSVGLWQECIYWRRRLIQVLGSSPRKRNVPTPCNPADAIQRHANSCSSNRLAINRQEGCAHHPLQCRKTNQFRFACIPCTISCRLLLSLIPWEPNVFLGHLSVPVEQWRSSSVRRLLTHFLGLARWTSQKCLFACSHPAQLATTCIQHWTNKNNQNADSLQSQLRMAVINNNRESLYASWYLQGSAMQFT